MLEKTICCTDVKNNRSEWGEQVYLLYFAIMIGARALGLYEGMMAYNIILVFGMSLFFLKMVITKHSIQEYLMTLILLVIAIMVYLHTGEKGLLVCFSMLLGMKEVSVKKVIRVGIGVAGGIVLVKVFLGVFGICSEKYYPQIRAGAGVMFRHTLGYAHPNTLHMNVLVVSMLILYLVTCDQKKKKRNNILIVLIASIMVFLFNLYVFQYSGSRTGILACAVYILVNLELYFKNSLGVGEKIISLSSFPAVCFISIAMPLVLSDDLFFFLDRTIFNSRFRLARYFWKYNSLSAWGVRLNNPEEKLKTYGIDMSQLYLFLQLGLIAFVTVSILFLWFIYECIKWDRRAELAVMIGMLFVGIWEPMLYNLGFKNFVFVFIGAMLFGITNGTLSFFDEAFFVDFDDGRLGQVISIVIGSIIIGLMMFSFYLLTTDRPSALYGDREENEAGISFEMEPLYFTEIQIKSLEENGDIVIGYKDLFTPMYQYDQNIAVMEYKKKASSVGVWSALVSSVVMLGFLRLKGTMTTCRKRRRENR